MVTLTIEDLIDNNVNIFDFNYPIFREQYRKTFEEMFIDNFYYDEIGFETISRFKHRLKNKLNLIMPYYNKIYETLELEQRILDNYDITEVYERISDGIGTIKSDSDNRNMYKDAPKTKIDINNFDVLTNLTKNIGKNETTSNNKNNEKWTRTMQGNIGVATDSDAIQSYWKSLRKIEEEIFEELEILFMGVFDNE